MNVYEKHLLYIGLCLVLWIVAGTLILMPRHKAKPQERPDAAIEQIFRGQ